MNHSCTVPPNTDHQLLMKTTIWSLIIWRNACDCHIEFISHYMRLFDQNFTRFMARKQNQISFQTILFLVFVQFMMNLLIKIFIYLIWAEWVNIAYIEFWMIIHKHFDMDQILRWPLVSCYWPLILGDHVDHLWGQSYYSEISHTILTLFVA